MPVWPTWCWWSIQPASTTARDAPSAAPSASSLDSAAARHDDVGFGDVLLLRLGRLDPDDAGAGGDLAYLERFDFRFGSGFVGLRGKDVRPRRRDLEQCPPAVHLGARLPGVHGPRRDEAVGLEAKVHDVGKNRHVVSRGEPGRDVLAHRRRGDQHGVRTVLLRGRVQSADVPLVAVEGEVVPVGDVYDAGPVFPEAGGERRDARARQHCGDRSSRETPREGQRL